MLRKIMLATDFSERARNAYAFTARLAEHFGAKIYLVHFANSRAPDYSGTSDEEHARAIYMALKRETQHTAFASHSVTFRRLNRRVSQSLPLFENEARCDMVVTGTWRRKGMDRLLSTDFADEIVATSTVPVLVHGNIGDEWHTTEPIRVLVPVERQDWMHDRVPTVDFLATNFNCTFEFLFVQKRDPNQLRWYSRFWSSKNEPQKEVQELYDELKQSELAELNTTLEFQQGVPADAIARRAREINANLVVVGARGFRVALAQRVIRQVDCSVMTLARDRRAYQKWLDGSGSTSR